MSIAVTEGHRSVAETVRSFAAKRDLRGAARELLEAPGESLPQFWAELGELGWLGQSLRGRSSRRCWPARSSPQPVTTSCARASCPASPISTLTSSGMPHWPEPWGRSAGAVEQLVIEQEFGDAGITWPSYGITAWNILTIIQYATDDQIERWVRPALDQEVIWCQLFSEPDAAGPSTCTHRTRRRDPPAAGGTSEVKRNQIGERILGLPRDPLIK